MGVRGVKLAAGDGVISMSILRHAEQPPVEGTEDSERDVYLRQAAAMRRAASSEEDAAEGCRAGRRPGQPAGAALHRVERGGE